LERRLEVEVENLEEAVGMVAAVQAAINATGAIESDTVESNQSLRGVSLISVVANCDHRQLDTNRHSSSYKLLQ
jgi:hypothetical protein